MYRKKVVLATAGACLLLLVVAFGISSSGLFANNNDDGGSSGGDFSSEGDSALVHEDPSDYLWEDTEAVNITLGGSGITVATSGVASVSGSTVTITSAGTYRLSGTLTNGQIIVYTKDEATVRLILNGVDISCSAGPVIYIQKANKTVIVLAEGTDNFVSDGSSYSLPSGEEEPDAAIFSKSDLTICGAGSLSVEGNYRDGIACKDGLIIANGTIVITAVDDGIRGKDYLIIEEGTLSLSVGGDGLKSTNDGGEGVGYVAIEGGTFDITSGADGIQAETDVIITGGDFEITSGGGSSQMPVEQSSKGIKGNSSVAVEDASFSIDSADDAIHSNGDVVIDGGFFEISTGDDGIHAEDSVTVNGGVIEIVKSYEGVEGAEITINGGEIRIASSDDGINTAGGNDGSGFTNPGMPGQGGGAMNSGSYPLYINGGYVYVNAAGDGLDINGPVAMTGGTVIVDGPIANDNGALDFVSFSISGGFLLAVGSSGMAMAPSSASPQPSLSLYSRTSISAVTLIHLEDTAGNALFTFSPAKSFASIVFSSPELVEGSSYVVFLGGSDTGTPVDGLYLGGVYTAGTNVGSFTAS